MSAKDDRSPEVAAHSVTVPRQEALVVRLGELIDLFLKESDPAKWPGDKTPADRGDRFWLKRNAEATGRLAMRARQLLEPAVGAGEGLTPDQQEERAAAREAEATQLRKQGIAILDRHRRLRGERA